METVEFSTVLFCSRKSEAGFNEMRVPRDRVQFLGGGAIGEGNHDLIAILHHFYHLVAIGRGFVSLVHELFFCTVSWFRVSRLAAILNYSELCSGGNVLKRLILPGHRELVVLVEKS